MKNFTATIIFLISMGFMIYPEHTQACDIWDVEATVLDCNEAGQFFVLLNFEYTEVGNDGFRVQGNGQNYGSFSYEDLPVQIGPLEGDGITVYEFVVIDNQFEGCTNCTAIDPVNCEGGSGGECIIGEMEVSVFDCNDEGMFMSSLDFEYEGVSESGFNAYVNNEYFGNYDYGQLPIELGPFAGDGETIYNYFVVDAEDESCHGWTAIDPVDCEGGGGGDCWMSEMEAGILPCNESGNYYVLLDFDYEHVSDEGFKLWVNGELNESYDYDELPIEVGPLPGDGETAHHFLVRDIIYEDCASDINTEAVDCDGGGSCWIGELDIAVGDCNEAGQFYVNLDFEYEAVSEAGFYLYVNDALYESYTYDQLPIEPGPFEGDGSTEYHFFVSDQVFEGCNSHKAIYPLECDGGGDQSNIPEETTLYPNPVIQNGVMQLNDQIAVPRDVYLYDLKGNEAMRLENTSENSFKLPSELKSGIYFFRVEAGGKTYRGKVSVK